VQPRPGYAGNLPRCSRGHGRRGSPKGGDASDSESIVVGVS
jgi:hypothetical protein